MKIELLRILSFSYFKMSWSMEICWYKQNWFIIFILIAKMKMKTEEATVKN